MKQRSPYYHVDAIQRAQSEKMIQALAAAHKDVQSLKLNDEGRLITRWPSISRCIAGSRIFWQGVWVGAVRGSTTTSWVRGLFRVEAALDQLRAMQKMHAGSWGRTCKYTLQCKT